MAIIAMAASGMLAACSSHAPRAVSDGPATTSALPETTSTSSTTTPPKPPEPAATVVATLHGAAPASARPGAAPVSQVPASWYGSPSVLPVLSSTPGWVEVREAQRPNESTAWVPASDVTLSIDPYFLVVSLATEHLRLFFHGYPVLDVPVGVGLPATPTVTGIFFIAMKARAPSPGYGPFVLVTSAHSNTFTDWEGAGDAIIAIHGPIDATADRLIGTTGARVSNGCIRLHVADLARLAGVPAGTPVDIVN
jgi:lipoprotein-anchoring transpeptidase ErfK/SrfK